VLDTVRQLAGFEAPAAAWERAILPARVKGYRPGWLDELALTGQIAWGRLWGTGAGAIRATPITLFPRDDLDAWLGLATPGDSWSLNGTAKVLHDVLHAKGACFGQELGKHAGCLPSQRDDALAEMIGLGLVTCDAFAGLRRLVRPANRRRARNFAAAASMGRWSLFRHGEFEPPGAEFVARTLLARTGVVFRRVLERERQPVPWRDLLRVLRTLEARGEIRGGRFVAGFSGEQYALPDAVTALRKLRKEPKGPPIQVAAGDPLNLVGILTPDDRVAANARQRVLVG
jgi:ATP-dependent Lhr-like helicase